MKEICQKEKCVGCLNCYNTCKFSAIKLIEDDLGFVYAEKDLDKCIQCGICENKCPILKDEINKINKQECYACKNYDNEIRLKSSSGGIFYLIAAEIINNNGIVFGAKFDKDFNVVHGMIDKKEDIELFMGSKYVQSNVGYIFKIIQQKLEKNVLVFFTGTPCQVAALKSFLNKEYENLITQDFVCHGVGSKNVLKQHIKEIKEKYKFKDLKKINFRSKATGWKNFSFSISDEKNQYSKDIINDNYMKTFLKNLCLRKSCYDCRYKKKNRWSDITLADFWNVDKVVKDFDDDKGVSAVIINSEKGQIWFNKIKRQITFKKVNYDDISKNNICLDNSAIYNTHRNEFIKDLKNGTKLNDINKNYYKR